MLRGPSATQWLYQQAQAQAIGVVSGYDLSLGLMLQLWEVAPHCRAHQCKKDPDCQEWIRIGEVPASDMLGTLNMNRHSRSPSQRIGIK